MRQLAGSIGFARRAASRARPFAVVLIAAGLLGACSTLDFLGDFGNDPPPDERAGIFDPALAPPPPDETVAATPRDKPKPPARRAPARASEPPREPITPDGIVGLAEGDAEKLFGPPHFVIRRQPSTRWHYVSERCTLDLFFFEDIETRERRVLAYDVGAAAPGEGPASDPGALNACVAAIHAERDGRAG